MKLLPRMGIAILLLCVTCSVNAQGAVAQATRTDKLEALAERLRAQNAQDLAQARAYASARGIPVRRDWASGRAIQLLRARPGEPPLWYITNNIDAADTVSTDEVWPGGSASLNLTGLGMTVGQWDTGAVYAAHDDLVGRVSQMDVPPAGISGHSTHVAGTLIGSGTSLYPQAIGMAYQASLEAYDWEDDTTEMALAAAGGMLVSNHSYGAGAGWVYIGDLPPDNWWWAGGSADTDLEDPQFGFYDVTAQTWDQIAYDAPYYLIVKAAGNDRTDIGPPPGEEYRLVGPDGTGTATSFVSRPPDCFPLGYDCLPLNSVAKNILTVGAVDDIPGGYSPLSGAAGVAMADFSSWGPTDDGRIKPDLVGNGMFLLSTWWPDVPFFAVAAGTSMASPNVSGSLLLLQEHYENAHGAGNYLRAATLKALALHTADEAGAANGPDYSFGWGLLNTKKAAEVITEDGGDHQIIEGSLADGGLDSFAVSVADADAVVVATLVWTDPPGTPVAFSLDPADLMLVNDLDLRITKNGSTWLPWVLDPADPVAAATEGDNFRDNVEQVEVNGAGAGNYTVQVTHKGILLNSSNQDYGLIISVLPAPASGTGLFLDEDFTGGLPPGWSVAGTSTGPIEWEIVSPVPGDSRLDNLTTGSGKFALLENQYAYTTVSRLITPLLDFSSNTGAVLRFREFSNYDTFETFNVDVSTNGGTNWTEVWTRMGYTFIPGQEVVDLSSIVAGEPNVKIAFRFDSEGWISGDVWQVDNVEVEAFGGGPGASLAGLAIDPVPGHNATGVDINTLLSWTAGADTDSYDVYFGTGSPGNFQGNQAGASFDPGTLAYSTTYYWRIDSVNTNGTRTGNVWTFTTQDEPAPQPPDPATGPAPGNGAADVNIDSDLGWTAGAGADSHDVHFGTTSPGAFQGNQGGTSFEPGTLAYATTYFWRIDEVNADGTTQGSVWSFATEAEPPATPMMHVAAIDGWGVDASRNRWHAVARTAVVDEGGSPVGGVSVSGAWSSGASGGGSCTTDGAGRCEIQKNNLKGNVSNVTFTVTDLVLSGHDYDSGANAVSSTVINRGDPPPPAGNQAPTASFTSNCTDLDCNFDGTASNDPDGSIVSYSWDFGDGDSGSGATPSHSYGVANTYTVVLTVTDNEGATGDDSSDVTVPPPVGSGNMSVVAIVVDTQSAGGGTKSPRAFVTIEDDVGNPVGSATVTGDFDPSDAGSEFGVSGNTDGSGTATLVGSNSKKGKLKFTFCVSNVTAAGLSYDAGGNTLTCASN